LFFQFLNFSLNRSRGEDSFSSLQRSIATLNGQKVFAKFIAMSMLKFHSGVQRDVAKSSSFPFLVAG
jgi:uncharacterized MAPEG superfamily protein